MTQSSRRSFSLRIASLGVALLAAAFLFSSCNDEGVSPYPPSIKYKLPIVDTIIYSKFADTVISSLGAVDNYSITPALPSGVSLNGQTGIISGRAALPDSAKTYTITAIGPSGSATATVRLHIKDDSRAPYVTYYPGGADGPGFMWTSPGAVLTPDTPVSEAGPVGSYKIIPALPAGVVLDSVTGIISGTPTATLSPAVEYNVIAKSIHGADTASVYLAVYPTSYPFALLQRGLGRFQQICADCHQSNGWGSRCPPLYRSDFLMANKDRTVRIQLMGLPNFVDTSTTIIVKSPKSNNPAGDTLNTSMPSIGGNDSDIAGVLTFVRAFMGLATDYVSVDSVGKIRDKLCAQDTTASVASCVHFPPQ